MNKGWWDNVKVKQMEKVEECEFQRTKVPLSQGFCNSLFLHFKNHKPWPNYKL